MPSEQQVTQRRSFFRKLGLLAVAALAAPLAARRSGHAFEPQTPRAQGQGYRLTPHIRKYYETAAK